MLGGIGANELWFDTSVFSAPAALTWGNVERNALLTGPGYVNLDASIVKIIRIRITSRRNPGGLLQRPEYAALRKPERLVRQRDLRPRHGNPAVDRAHDPIRWKVLVLTQYWQIGGLIDWKIVFRLADWKLPDSNLPIRILFTVVAFASPAVDPDCPDPAVVSASPALGPDCRGPDCSHPELPMRSGGAGLRLLACPLDMDRRPVPLYRRHPTPRALNCTGPTPVICRITSPPPATS